MAQSIDQAIQNAQSGGNKKQEPADAWINFSVVDKKGNEHSFRGFNPVYKDKDKLQRNLYEQAVKNGGELEITLKAVVRVSVQDDGKDLEF